MRRTLLGMSQEKLGEAIGLTFQQVQKYERGSNRISAGTLYRLGQVLDIPVSFFFDCYDDPHAPLRPPRGVDGGPVAESVISRREARLLRLWRAAPDSVADEMLSLLGSLSPHLGDPREEEDSAAAAPAPPPAPAKRIATPRVKAEKTSNGKPRRRHGAVWDPTDIYRAAKSTKVTT
ncbi:helix-turn-helix domain-containing protein [Azospirillum rugosum]|uniref:Transcriptional regulator with XRE-family HTH domain n=1 Tax=Azospirillum rugosum TaxID=416170 RepID=A0ABS4SQN2_9PROT|nr:transcriptional regulator with XRE-family HTH domain [Azospirillum rugosum]MDQ0528209.1 transcriptional regulator with XRE-family HTH domain [Azospirillum rugosum]